MNAPLHPCAKQKCCIIWTYIDIYIFLLIYELIKTCTEITPVSFVSDVNLKYILRWSKIIFWSSSHFNWFSFVFSFQRHRPGGGWTMGEPAPPHPRAPPPREEHRRPRHHQGDHPHYHDGSSLMFALSHKDWIDNDGHLHLLRYETRWIWLLCLQIADSASAEYCSTFTFLCVCAQTWHEHLCQYIYRFWALIPIYIMFSWPDQTRLMDLILELAFLLNDDDDDLVTTWWYTVLHQFLISSTYDKCRIRTVYSVQLLRAPCCDDQDHGK